MRLELIAILQAVIVTAGIHVVSPDRRMQIIALVGATGGQRPAMQHFSLLIFGSAVPSTCFVCR